jgi:hypothetical protein
MNEKIRAALKNIFIQFSTFRLSMQPLSRDTISTSDERTRAHTTTTTRDVTCRGREKRRETERHFDGDREEDRQTHTHTHTHTHTRRSTRASTCSLTLAQKKKRVRRDDRSEEQRVISW